MGGLVLIEGLDLAGKSTLVRGLQSRYERHGQRCRVAHGDLCPENPVGAVARQMMRHDPGFTGAEGAPLFLAAHLWDVRTFRPDPSSVHLQDSWALRSLAYEEAQGSADYAARFRELLQVGPSFDAAFILTASLKVRQARFRARAANDRLDAQVFNDPVAFQRVDACLATVAVELAGAKLVITDELNPDQLLELVWRNLSDRGLTPKVEPRAA